MSNNSPPEFAIVGHPNEGKSSVVSTLAEDDSVRISSYPGETIGCRSFPVTIDGQEVIRFTDTPGFQNPKKILAWMKNYNQSETPIVTAFRREHLIDPDFKEDCELFEPIERGAGIIYVADGSRPIRKVDLAEMEIFRLTGLPRMAIINCKEDATSYLDDWKNEFRKHFNVIRKFNAHKATYAERIALLDSLKSIDQDLAPALDKVISAFREDWKQRISMTTEVVINLLDECLSFSMTMNFAEKSSEDKIKKKLWNNFNSTIQNKEAKAHKKIQRLFKHNIFSHEFPPHSILNEDLFSEKTWQFLGLTPRQLATAAGITGGAIGAALDIAAAGLTFGVFTAIGGILGAGWTALGGGKKLAKTKVVGLNLGGQQMKIGPIKNIQFMYVLMDRVLIYYSYAINWAHGRRDYPQGKNLPAKNEKAGYSSNWDNKFKSKCNDFYVSVIKKDDSKKEASAKNFKEALEKELLVISESYLAGD